MQSPQTGPIAGRAPDRRALGGVLFLLFFIGGEVARALLTTRELPLPGSPAEQTVAYVEAARTATLTVGIMQVLAALSLFLFVPAITSAVRRATEGRTAPARITSLTGVLAAAFLLVSALLSLALTLSAGSMDLSTVDLVRELNFRTGGVAHVVSLGLFTGTALLTTRGTGALPRGTRVLGMVAAVPAVLAVLSIPVYMASVLLPVGRILCMVWALAVGAALIAGSRRAPAGER
ncbi:MAG: hypothetical protein GEV11_17570 [Streptosporangiales bacterium]|nr:hypothetical protein [Streptosporangiales bacterium]